VIRWSYGYRVLLAPEPTVQSSKLSPDEPEETAPLIKPYNNRGEFDTQSDYISTSRSTTSLEPVERPDRRSLRSVSRESLTSFPALSGGATETPSNRLTFSIRKFLGRVAGIMNPPLWAVLASVIVALITPLQHELFFNLSGFLHNSVFLAIDTAGATAIPLILVSLGASLPKSLDILDLLIDTSAIDPKFERRGIFLALFCRMALVPLTMFPILVTVMHFGIK